MDKTTSSSIESPLLTSFSKTSRPLVIPNHQHKELRKITTNFRSIENKATELEVLIETTVIIGVKSLKNRDILSSEIFTNDYTVYRKYRGKDDLGGVVIAVYASFASSEIFSRKSGEQITVKIDLTNGKQLIYNAIVQYQSNIVQA